jgi:hypothetical protein
MHRANAGGESKTVSERERAREIESEREVGACTGPTLAVFRDNAILAEFVRIAQ